MSSAPEYLTHDQAVYDVHRSAEAGDHQVGHGQVHEQVVRHVLHG